MTDVNERRRQHIITTDKFRELLRDNHIDNTKFMKMHHRGTPALAHLAYMEKTVAHNAGSPNDQISGWIDRRWEKLIGSQETDFPAGAIQPNEPLATQEGGSHYTDMAIQPVEYIHANGLGFCEGAVIKYVSRHKAKSGRQDLEKARHFIDLLISLEYPE